MHPTRIAVRRVPARTRRPKVPLLLLLQRVLHQDHLSRQPLRQSRHRMEVSFSSGQITDQVAKLFADPTVFTRNPVPTPSALTPPLASAPLSTSPHVTSAPVAHIASHPPPHFAFPAAPPPRQPRTVLSDLVRNLSQASTTASYYHQLHQPTEVRAVRPLEIASRRLLTLSFDRRSIAL